MSAVKVTLAGTDYEVPKMNIGQLEEVTAAFDLAPARRTYAILKIALRRASPKIDKPDDLEADTDEIAGAVKAILTNSGFKTETPKDPKDPNPDAPKVGGEN